MPTKTKATERQRRAQARKRLESLKGRPDKIKESDIEAALADMEEAFLECRDRGHRWGRDHWSRTQQGNLLRTMICGNCKTKCNQRLRWDGTIYARWYEYLEGYMIAGAKDRRAGLRVQQVRAEVIRRNVGEEGDDAKIVAIRSKGA